MSLLKSIYDSADELPEGTKDFYTEKEGKFHFNGVEGWKSPDDFNKVTGALTSERKTRKELEAAYEPWKVFGDKTPAQIQADLEKIPLLEEGAKNGSREKIDAMIETAAKNRLAPVERDRDAAKARVQELEGIVAQHEANNKKRTIWDAVRSEAAKDGTFHEVTYAGPNGTLMLLASQMLTIDEHSGAVVVADDVPGMAAGLGVKDALAELKNQHPYLVKGSNGGGATGSNGAGSGPNPFKGNNMQARAQLIQQYKDQPEKWTKLMQAAGLKNPAEMYKGKA